MAKKDPVEMARAIALKRIRARVRLEAAVRADLVLNEIESEFLDEFDRRVAAGEPYELTSYEEWVRERVDRRFPALPPRRSA